MCFWEKLDFCYVLRILTTWFVLLNNASGEIKLICKKYSANVNNIYTCIRRAAFGAWLDCLFLSYYVKLSCLLFLYCCHLANKAVAYINWACWDISIRSACVEKTAFLLFFVQWRPWDQPFTTFYRMLKIVNTVCFHYLTSTFYDFRPVAKPVNDYCNGAVRLTVACLVHAVI